MKEGPNIVFLGALIGDPARSNMLIALMSGKALTVSELASEANVSLQTASAHISKLRDGGLLRERKQGRHRYLALADEDVANLLENMMGLAAKKGYARTRTGPKDPALRKARVCYNHLAGELGVSMYESLLCHGHLRADLSEETGDIELTTSGRIFVAALGIDLSPLEKQRRPLCKSCLDWSARRTHLAGALGVGLLDRMLQLKWAKRQDGTRIVAFTSKGEAEFRAAFPATPAV